MDGRVERARDLHLDVFDVQPRRAITEWRASSGLQSGSCSGVGASFASTAFLNPAASNASCQLSTPFLTYGTHLRGVAESIQYTIGFTGSDSAALGSFFSSLHLVM